MEPKEEPTIIPALSTWTVSFKDLFDVRVEFARLLSLRWPNLLVSEGFEKNGPTWIDLASGDLRSGKNHYFARDQLMAAQYDDWSHSLMVGGEGVVELASMPADRLKGLVENSPGGHSWPLTLPKRASWLELILPSHPEVDDFSAHVRDLFMRSVI